MPAVVSTSTIPPIADGRRRLRAFRLAAGLLAACCASLTAPAASAQEYLRDEEPAPESLEQKESPISKGFEEDPEDAPEVEPPEPEEPERDPVLPRIWRPDEALAEKLDALPPFLRDTVVDLAIRSYYFDADRPDGDDSRAWALGGALRVRSGWLLERLAVGATLYTSQRLHGPRDKPGSLLLEPIQNSFTVLGQAHVKLRQGSHVATLFRQRYDLPYLNANDSRMVPNTFEGYSVEGKWPFGRYAGGWVERIKPRNDDEFIPMSKAAGVRERDRGLAFGGIEFRPVEDFAVGAIAQVVPDVLSTVYSEGEGLLRLTDELTLQLNANFTDQRSVGDDLLTGSSFDTQSGGALMALSYRSVIVGAAISKTSDEAAVRNPFGGSPSYLSFMIRNFTAARELAWGVGISYEASRLGLPGVSGFLYYARGNDAIDASTRAKLPDDDEINATLDFRPKSGWLRGSWIRVRGAFLNPAHSHRSVEEIRVIFNYTLPVL